MQSDEEKAVDQAASNPNSNGATIPGAAIPEGTAAAEGMLTDSVGEQMVQWAAGQAGLSQETVQRVLSTMYAGRQHIPLVSDLLRSVPSQSELMPPPPAIQRTPSTL